MPGEDKNFGGSLVLDFRKWWRHVKTIYTANYYSEWSEQCSFILLCHIFRNNFLQLLCIQSGETIHLQKFITIIQPTKNCNIIASGQEI